jgi:multisubunit Na+/H+ antiporter MnhC subunit
MNADLLVLTAHLSQLLILGRRGGAVGGTGHTPQLTNEAAMQQYTDPAVPHSLLVGAVVALLLLVALAALISMIGYAGTQRNRAYRAGGGRRAH